MYLTTWASSKTLGQGNIHSGFQSCSSATFLTLCAASGDWQLANGIPMNVKGCKEDSGKLRLLGLASIIGKDHWARGHAGCWKEAGLPGCWYHTDKRNPASPRDPDIQKASYKVLHQKPLKNWMKEQVHSWTESLLEEKQRREGLNVHFSHGVSYRIL